MRIILLRKQQISYIHREKVTLYDRSVEYLLKEVVHFLIELTK